MDRLKKYIAECFEDYGSLNTHWLCTESDAMRIYCVLCHTLYDTPEAQDVINWDAGFDKEEYWDLVDILFNKTSASTDSNYTYEKLRAFTAWAILDIDKRKKDMMTAKKRSRLEELEKEKINIESELSELRQPPSKEATRDEQR